MSDKGKNGGRRTTPPEARQARLKTALRENLKRRKLQARERGDVERLPASGAQIPSSDDGGDDRGG